MYALSLTQKNVKYSIWLNKIYNFFDLGPESLELAWLPCSESWPQKGPDEHVDSVLGYLGSIQERLLGIMLLFLGDLLVSSCLSWGGMCHRFVVGRSCGTWIGNVKVLWHILTSF